MNIYEPKKIFWKLRMTAYGLIESAKIFLNKVLKVMKELRFRRSKCNPCVYFK